MKDLAWFLLKDNPFINLWIKYFTNFDALNERKFKKFNSLVRLNLFYKNKADDYILTKDDIRSGYELLTANYKWPSSIGYTSGTTNTPLKLKRSIPSIIYDEACLKKHWYDQGVPLMPRVATLRGDVIPDNLIKDKRFWLEMKLTRRLLMSSFNLSKENINFYTDKLDSFKPDIILAYPSAILSFSKFALELGWKPPSSFIGVFTSGEFFSIEDQALVKQVFGEVFDHYGQAERVARFQQCKAGNYHIKNGYSFVDFVRRGDKYEIIGTAYHNKAMPIVRYQTGDFINELPNDTKCECGLLSNFVKSIEGREGGVLISPTGKEFPYAGLSRIVYGMNNLAELQYVKKSDGNSLIIRYNTLTGKACTSLENEILTSIIEMLGNEFLITFEYTETIPRNKSGKLSAVICE